MVDLFRKPMDGTLTDFIKKGLISNENYLEILEIAEIITEILEGLHEKKVTIKNLKPDLVQFMKITEINSIRLAVGSNPSIEENEFIKKFVDVDDDYYCYDTLCMGFMLLTLFNQKIQFNALFTVKT